MTTQEIELLKEHIIKLIYGNKQGVSLAMILEYLDYVNRVVYSELEVMPILEKLINDHKILKIGEAYFSNQDSLL